MVIFLKTEFNMDVYLTILVLMILQILLCAISFQIKHAFVLR